MIVNKMNLSEAFQSACRRPSGRVAFVEEIRKEMGLNGANGQPLRDHAGNIRLGERKLRPEQFSIRDLAESIIGPSWSAWMDPSQLSSLARYNRHQSLMENSGRSLLEANGIGVDPTSFLNINTFTAIVGGLVEVKILETYNNPAFIADKIAPAEPTKMLGGQKIIGVTQIGDRARKRLPGQATERASFSERWVETPETEEHALAIDVNKETVFSDLTGEILRVAGDIGKELGYRKELRVLDVFAGVNNSTYKYNGTVYNTYVTTSTLGYLNDFSNPLLDWTSINAVMMKFKDMADPHTGKRLLTQPNMIVCNPAALATLQLILGATSTERRTTPGATMSTGSSLNISVSGSNPFAGQFEIASSPLLDQRCTDADGLNLSQANADQYFWVLEAGKPFRYMQAYPLTVTQAAPNQYEMLDKGIVATYFANERGIPSVWDPHYVVRSKN
jgi:hypothetical protein